MKKNKKQFHILTIYPKIFDSYFSQAIIKTALDKKIIKIDIHDLRKYALDKHGTVDDKPYGGGAGMILKVDVVWRAIKDITKNKKTKTKIMVFSPKGKTLAQKDLVNYKKYEKIIMVCGRFEGVDQRIIDYIADEEISVGNYVLAGGEIPAMIVTEGITRLLPNVLGNQKSLEEESFKEDGFLEYPQYTRPAKFKPARAKKIWAVPEILLSGHHEQIKKYRHSKK